MDERYKLNTIAIKARYWNPNCNKFSGTDSEEAFRKNLLKMPSDWKYRTKEIEYNVNSLGYRTKEFDQIDHSNFFIAYGCSFTFGVGLAEDEMWTTTLAEELGMDCFNLGMGGSGMDYAYLNTLTYLKNTSIRPKFVALQCPEPARMVMRSLEHFELSGPSFPGTNGAVDMYNQAIKDGSWMYNTYLALYNFLVFWETAGVPVYLWAGTDVWEELGPNLNWNYHWPYDDEAIYENRARDLIHFPASYQIRTGKTIAEHIKNDPKFGLCSVDNMPK